MTHSLDLLRCTETFISIIDHEKENEKQKDWHIDCNFKRNEGYEDQMQMEALTTLDLEAANVKTITFEVDQNLH